MSDKDTQLAIPANSAVSNGGKAGAPSKYEPEVVERLLGAIGDGLTIGQACKAAGIGQSTLSDWREQHPELLPRLEAAREQARRHALDGIKAAGDAGDWRALEAFLKYSFWKDYRQNPSVQVNATATAQAAAIVTEEQRKKLIELRERVLNGPATTLHGARELSAPNNNAALSGAITDTE